MSDTPLGPGWWQASDDKWYPPPRPAMPTDEPAAAQPVAPPQATAPYQPGTETMPSPPAAPSAAPPSPAGGAPPYGPAGPPSPFDMPPVPPPGGSTANRAPLYVLLSVLVVGLLVSLVVLMSDDDGGSPGPSTSPSSTDTSGSVTTGGGSTTDGTGDTTATNGGGEISIVDSGVSSFQDQLMEAETYSWAVVVENTGDRVAYGTTVDVGFLNEDGEVVDNESVIITIILPGQRFGIGDAPYVEQAGVVDLDVTVQPPQEWREPSGYEEIVTSDIGVSRGDYEAPAVSFDAQSSYDQRINRVYAYAIFYNAEGEIVGGARNTSAPYLPPDGRISSSVEALTSIPGIDDAKTEVFVDPQDIS